MTTNLAASVHARLANQAKAKRRPFQEVLQHYGLERLLYRLASSPHQNRFLLKGALLLQAWGAPASTIAAPPKLPTPRAPARLT